MEGKNNLKVEQREKVIIKVGPMLDIHKWAVESHDERE
jgi:hypothetical protein